ncbi:hypothetical protein [Burkholderia glumae]|uniref:hypothetical protein n=1 Tax=Burkholderia glumae TaxID=337 RepID=UPI00227CDAB6|nr:hypothetical protein [Burkholderia glumae]
MNVNRHRAAASRLPAGSAPIRGSGGMGGMGSMGGIGGRAASAIGPRRVFFARRALPSRGQAGPAGPHPQRAPTLPATAETNRPRVLRRNYKPLSVRCQNYMHADVAVRRPGRAARRHWHVGASPEGPLVPRSRFFVIVPQSWLEAC